WTNATRQGIEHGGAECAVQTGISARRRIAARCGQTQTGLGHMNKTALVLILLLMILPWLALAVLGGFWLWQNQYLLIVAPLLLSSYGIAWILSRKLKHDQPLPPSLPRVDPDDRWSPAAQVIWNKIDTLAKS